MKRSQRSNAPPWHEYLDERPIIVALAGPNGAGKSTFFDVHLRCSGLRFLNADLTARELDLGAYEAARAMAAIRTALVIQRESFIFETVFSDPVDDKLGFLKETAQSGYAVVLCFIGIEDVETSDQRVSMRVTQGGHDVPVEKLVSRFPRTLANLAAALRELPCVLLFDNDNLRTPFRHVATYMNGHKTLLTEHIPSWLKPLL